MLTVRESSASQSVELGSLGASERSGDFVGFDQRLKQFFGGDTVQKMFL